MDALLAYDSSDSGDEEFSSKLPAKSENMMKSASGKVGKTESLEERQDHLSLHDDSLNRSVYRMYNASQSGSRYDHCTSLPHQTQYNRHQNHCSPQHEEVGPHLPVKREDSCRSSENTKLYKPSIGPIRHSDVKTINTGFKTRPYVSKRERLEQASECGGSGTKVTRCVNMFRDKSTGLKNTDTSFVVNRPPKRVLHQFQGHSKCVNHIRWNSTTPNLLASASMDHTVAIWDTNRSGLCLSRLTFHEAAVKDVKWRPCGTQVLSCGFDKCAKLVDVNTGKMIQNFPHKEFVTCVQLYPSDPNLFLSGTSRNGIYCWDIREHKIVSTYQAPFGQVQDIAFLPGGEQFISAAEVLRRNSTDKGIMVWDFRTTAVMSNQIYQEAFTCTCLKVHPSGSFFAAQSNANYIALFATQRPYKLNKYKRYEGHQVSAYVVGFDFSPDGSLVVSGSADGKMYIYNSRTSRCISSLPVNSSVCMDTSYHPSLPSTVATCGFDGQIAILV